MYFLLPWQVDNVRVMDEAGFAAAKAWLGDAEAGVEAGVTLLSDALNMQGFVTIPTTNLRVAAGDAGRTRPQRKYLAAMYHQACFTDVFCMVTACNTTTSKPR